MNALTCPHGENLRDGRATRSEGPRPVLVGDEWSGLRAECARPQARHAIEVAARDVLARTRDAGRSARASTSRRPQHERASAILLRTCERRRALRESLRRLATRDHDVLLGELESDFPLQATRT